MRRNRFVQAACGLVCAVLWVTLLAVPLARGDGDGKTWTVDRADIQVRIVERGVIESSRTVEIVNPLNTRSATAIKWVAEDGTMVKKGDKLVELDSSAIENLVRQQEVVIATREANLKDVRVETTIAEAILKRNLLAAEGTASIAELEYRTVTGGGDAMLRQRLELKVKQAGIAVEIAKLAVEKLPEDRVAKLNVAAAELELEMAKLDLKRAKEVDPIVSRRLQLQLDDARQGLATAKLQVERERANLARRLQAAEAELEKEKKTLESRRKMLDQCMLTAPADGMVVYVIPNNGFGGRSGSQVIAAGEYVNPGSAILRVVDLSAPMVVTYIPESVVASIRKLQSATVRVDAFPDAALTAIVADIDAFAQRDMWLRQNEKRYKVRLEFKPVPTNLKPGMSCEIGIDVREAKNVLRIPVSLVHRHNAKSVCYVRTKGGVEIRQIVLGSLSGDRKFYEVKAGLSVGEQILTAPPE